MGGEPRYRIRIHKFASPDAAGCPGRPYVAHLQHLGWRDVGDGHASCKTRACATKKEAVELLQRDLDEAYWCKPGMKVEDLRVVEGYPDE